jgi:sulfur-carrier protein
MITILVFGKLGGIIQRDTLAWPFTGDTDSLRQSLETTYPELATVAYRLAVNKKLAIQNEVLNDGAEVALLPPFSGG